MSAEQQHEEEEQFHSGEEGEVDAELDDGEIVLGARRSKASDDEEDSVDGDDDTVPASEPLDGVTAAPAKAGSEDGDREPLDVNLPDDLNEGDLGAGDRKDRVKPKPKFEPYVVPTSGAFYMHDDRFDETVEVEKPKRGPKKVSEDDRWKHDKFESLQNDQSDEDEPPAAHFGFRNRGRGRGRGRRGYGGGGGGYRGNGQGPPGFDEPPRSGRRSGPHPAEALREAEPYEADSFGPPPSLNPDAQPFRTGNGAQDDSFGGERKGADRSLDAAPAGNQAEGGAGAGGRGRGGGRRYSAIAGTLGGGN